MKDQEEKNPTNSINMILVVLLIIASFLIGSLWTNVEYLKKGSNVSNIQQAANNNNQPTDVAKPGTQPANTNVANPSNQVPTKGTEATIPPLSKDDHVRGDKNAKIVLIEYSDFECPFCKIFHPTAQKVLDSYQGKVMWVYRHFPLSFHTNALKEAEASECANELGGNDVFWSYVDKLYERTTSNGTGFALDKLAPLAKELGLDEVKFQSCLNSGKYTDKVNSEMAGGQAGGINGTPGNVLVNLKTGEMQSLPGAVPFEQIKTVIDKMLES